MVLVLGYCLTLGPVWGEEYFLVLGVPYVQCVIWGMALILGILYSRYLSVV